MLVGYQVTGSGPTDVVLAPGAVSHLELDWEDPERTGFINGLSTLCRLIRFDKRGTGVSDRPEHVALLEQRIEDIRGVMSAAGSERATIFGVSEGGAMACLFAATFPDLTRGLILWGTKARWLRTTDYPWGVDREAARRISDPEALVAQGWPPEWFLGAIGGTDATSRERASRYFRSATSPTAYLAQRRMLLGIDVRDVASAIGVPTLVLHRTGDRVVECDAGRDLAARIPGARFVELPGDDHAPWRGDDRERALGIVRDFLASAGAPLKTERALTTILFIDLVDSTKRASQLGDAAWKELLGRHYAYVRDALRTHGGHEVDTAGDGLLATFDGPARAIACATAIQRADAAMGLVSRAGVHTGEVERDGSAVRGIAVHLAARIAATAAPNEILVSSTVQDLVAGAQIRFEERGSHELKGFEGARRLLAVVP